MSDNSIEKRLGESYPISVVDRQFIADMRRAAANEVGYGFMQQVTEWEWQDKDEFGAWGPEYFEKEIERLTKQRDAYKLKAGHVEARYLPCPDHRDKHKTGDECLMCQLETLTTEGAVKDKEIERLRSVMQEKNDALSKAWSELAEYRDAASGKQR